MRKLLEEHEPQPQGRIPGGEVNKNYREVKMKRAEKHRDEHNNKQEISED